MISAASPSALDPAGSEASRLAGLWWLLFVLAAVVAVGVLTMVVVAMVRRPPADDLADEDAGGSGAERSARRDHRFIVLGGLVMPLLVLSVVAVANVSTTQDLRRPAAHELRVTVTGAQWFWRVAYPDGGVTSANLIRLPVGRPVVFTLRSQDVIHSFWVPQLAGKMDVIPGQTNQLRFTPTRVGTYRGECAEFCGLQHTQMVFAVDVMPASDFDRWLNAARGPSSPTETSAAVAAGRQVFAANSCAGCHAVAGVSRGTVGPDLTDFGTRPTIGAGSLVNNPHNLAAWITDPGRAKPGVHMPPTALDPTQRRALVAYLESLGSRR